jgi:hypothetical protein
MEKQYQLLLDKQRAKRMCMHLRNMRVQHTASEVGETICIQFWCLDTELADIRVLLDEVNNYYNINIEREKGDF